MARENEYLKSLKEWWTRVPKRWWEVLGTFLSLAAEFGGIVAFAIWARRIASPLPWWNIGLVVGGALLFLIISFLAFHRVREERDRAKEAAIKPLNKDDNVASIILELDTTNVLLNGVEVSISSLFWGLSDFLTGAYPGGGLREEAIPQLLARRFQINDSKISAKVQMKLITTLRIKELIEVEIIDKGIEGHVTYYVANSKGLKVLDRLKAKGWPEPNAV